MGKDGKILNIGGSGKKGIFPERLEITSMPKQTEYLAGDVFNDYGLSVEVYYSNGVHVPTRNFTITPSGPLTAADDHVTVLYTEAGKTVSVPVSIKVFGLYENLNLTSWAQISAISSAGRADEFWKPGDTKTIVLNGTVGPVTLNNFELSTVILGINHNAELEGTNRIHFGIGMKENTLISLHDGNIGRSYPTGRFVMNTTNRNLGGWERSVMRNDLLRANGPFMSVLPKDLQDVMKTVTKYTDNVGDESGEKSSNVSGTTDLLWLPAPYEVLGSKVQSSVNRYERAKQKVYDYFQAGNPASFYRYDDPAIGASPLSRSPNTQYKYSFYYITDTYQDSSGNLSGAIFVCFAV